MKSKKLLILAATTFLAARPLLAKAEVEPREGPNEPNGESSVPLGTTSRAFHADIEIDPTAYVLGGYSVHAGLGWRHVRTDLGAFAMNVPNFVHGNPEFDVSFDGFGAKLQWFPFEEQSGAFVGVDASVARALVRRRGTDLASRNVQYDLGVDAGWRLYLGAGFYATPWIGLGYAIGARDVELGGKTFESSKLVVFPAVHLGYHLR